MGRSRILVLSQLLTLGCRPAAEPTPETAPAAAEDSQQGWSPECDVDIPPPVEPDPLPEDAQLRTEQLARWAESPELTCPPGTRPHGPPLPVRKTSEYQQLLLMEEDESTSLNIGVPEWHPGTPTSQRCVDASGNGRYRIAEFYDGKYRIDEAGELRGNTLHGAALTWWNTDQVLARAWFHNGKRHGHWAMSLADGSLRGTTTYRHGKLHGLDTSFYEDGSIQSKLSWKEGRRHGPWLIYYPDGKRERDVTYLDHYRHGLAREWWPNGQLRVRLRYCEGKRFGEEEAFHENGARSSWTFFRDGEREGEQLDFNEKGEVTHRYFYRRGRNVGGLRPGAPRFSDFHDEPTPSASKDSKAPTQPEDDR